MTASIHCCLKPSPNPPAPWAANLRRGCVAAAAACVVVGAASSGMVDGNDAALAREMSARAAGDAAHVQTARWSGRRQCPPWRANSLENIVPEDLPRPSARRRFNSITAAKRAPASVIPFSPLPSVMDCFTL